MNVRITGYSDTFAKERLPAAHELPELHFDLPALQYRKRLNAATELLDRRV